MPVSLGSAIGGRYAIDFDITAPFSRGYQMGQQKAQQRELVLERKRQAEAKKDQDLLNQVQRSISFKDIDPLYEKMATEEAAEKLDEVYKLRETGNPENYNQALKKLNELKIINAKYSGLTRNIRQTRELYNKGLLSPEDASLFEKILNNNDIRNSKGLRDELSGAGVNDDYSVTFGANRYFDVNKAFDTELDNAKSQFLDRENTNLANIYQINKGIPATKQEAEKISKDAGVSNIISAESIAEGMWNNSEVRRQLIKDYGKELKNKFGGTGNVISQNPEAMDYLRSRFIEDSKRKGFQSTSYRNIPQKSGFTIGGGSYQFGNNVFNPTTKPPTQSLGLYLKEGIITPEQEKTYNNLPESEKVKVDESIRARVGDIISISGPNKGTYNVVDEKGKPQSIDNIEFSYLKKRPDGKGGVWYLTGIKKEKKGSRTKEVEVIIPINERTYGNIISVYPKMTKTDIENLFNNRLIDEGIDDKFILSPTTKKSSQIIKKQTPVKTSAKKKVVY